MFTKTFTDVQGTTHTNAFFKCAAANLASNTNNTYRFNPETKDEDLRENSNMSLSYSMYFWVNEEAYNDGKAPYQYYVGINNTSINVSDKFFKENPEYTELTLVEQAEKHCQEVVLSN